jgi:hypothetical protein
MATTWYITVEKQTLLVYFTKKIWFRVPTMLGKKITAKQRFNVDEQGHTTYFNQSVVYVNS